MQRMDDFPQTKVQSAESEYRTAVLDFLAGRGKPLAELLKVFTAAGRTLEDFQRDVAAGGPVSTRGLS